MTDLELAASQFNVELQNVGAERDRVLSPTQQTIVSLLNENYLCDKTHSNLTCITKIGYNIKKGVMHGIGW